MAFNNSHHGMIKCPEGGNWGGGNGEGHGDSWPLAPPPPAPPTIVTSTFSCLPLSGT